MRKLSIYMMLLLILLNCLCLNVWATADIPTETQPDEQYTESHVDEISGLDAPNAGLGTAKMIDNLRAAVGYEVNSGTMMYSWNADAAMYPASFVKIMTALVAIENGTLTDEVVVTDAAIKSIPYDAVSMKLSAGEVITLENLLYGLIVGSANDAAAVIAEHVCGTQGKFIELMNQYAQEIGCTGTTFTNVHGLHDENQHTTARDAAKILHAAIENEIFYNIFAAVTVDIPATNKAEMRNLMTGNSLMDKTSRLYFDGRAIGGRTGVTQDGRRCLAAVSKSNGMLLITIVMGAESVYQEDGYSAISVGGYKETSDLLDSCDSKYKAAKILYPGQILRQLSVVDGVTDLTVGPKDTITAVLPKEASGTDLTFTYVDKSIHAPVSTGDLVSQVQVWSNGMCIAQADMFAMNNVAVREQNDDVAENSNDWLSVIRLVAILALFLVAGVFLYKNRSVIHGIVLGFKKNQRKNRRKRR